MQGMDMVSITEEEYVEYSALKREALRIKNLISLSKITKLEDDIDLPIKRCVVAFALLGCEPLWSCCGFDYKGQPLHKSHQYGRIYFILGHNSFSEKLCEAITKSTDWEYCLFNGNLDLHIEPKNVVSQWDYRDCPHYHEPFVQYIQHLENYLFSMKDLFANEVVLSDTNGKYEKWYPYWAYPTFDDWVIRKEDYIS